MYSYTFTWGIISNRPSCLRLVYRLAVVADENVKTVGWLTRQSIGILNIACG
jgi:hypothetical protein